VHPLNYSKVQAILKLKTFENINLMQEFKKKFEGT